MKGSPYDAFTSPRLRGEVGLCALACKVRVRGRLDMLLPFGLLPLTPTLSPQVGRGGPLRMGPS